MKITETLFFLSALLLVYTYVGYPSLLKLLARLFPRRHEMDERSEPTVTFVISAYNEEDVIGEKIENTLRIDYPRRKFRVVVVSDASTDRTDEIVRAHGERGVRLIRMEERGGKTAGLNVALASADTDIVVFSDANAIYHPMAVRKMVRHFADRTVGYVVGYARYQETADTEAGTCENAYWELEMRIKKWESDFSSVVGGDGAIYAIRRELYEPLQPDDINDLVNPLQIVSKGYRGIFDPEAWCSEKPAGNFRKEFQRKVRITNRSFNGFLRFLGDWKLLRTPRFTWQILSHKILRWFSPYLLLFVFGLSLPLKQGGVPWILGRLFLFGVMLLGILSIAGYLGKRKSILSYFYYFLLMNLASATGIYLRVRGKTIRTWDTVRGSGSGGGMPLGILAFPAVVGLCLIVPMILFLADLGLLDGACRLCAYLSAALLFYTYLGYPAVLALTCRREAGPVIRADWCLPNVTLLTVAYNEEKVIGRKIENSLQLDYPRDRFRIVVASDGSTDRTETIVRENRSHGVDLFPFAPNRGKVAALCDAMEHIHSEIVVMSDANVMYEPQAIRKLVRNFNDPRVGAVSGKVILAKDNLSYGNAEDSYYIIEHFIQRMEGKTGELIGADGAMYAIRRSLFHPPAMDTVLDDLAIPMSIAREGHRVVHEAEAVGYEPNEQEIGEEFRRKIRIIAGGFQYLLRGPGLPGLSCPSLLFKFVSHKVLRWCSGLLTLMLFLALAENSLGSVAPDRYLVGAFYGMFGAFAAAALAHVMRGMKNWRVLGMLHYLCMLNLASLAGFYLGVLGNQNVTWRADAAKNWWRVPLASGCKTGQPDRGEP